MGKPAARLGDMTAHGGVITLGFPTVLIGGKPAARIGDMHVCPMFDGPKPHVGGPCAMGSPTVLIGGMPAARMGDMATCAGPPDTIAMGCPTVLIGESGTGGGGGGGGAAVAAAKKSAAVATMQNLEPLIREEHWIQFEFVDKAGNPISGLHYTFTDPEGNESHGILKSDGVVRRDGLSEGDCKIQLFDVFNARWSIEQAQVGEKVELSAEVLGYEDGTSARFQIYRRDIKGPDEVVANVEAEVRGGKVEGKWEYVSAEGDEVQTDSDTQRGYSAPEYYFDVIAGRSVVRSGVLDYKDYVELELKDDAGNPIANEDYILYLSNGEVRKGKLDGNGYAKENNVPPT